MGNDENRTVDGVIIHAAHAEWAMGESGPCLIAVWRGAVDEPAVHMINDQILKFTQERPGKCAYINVIESSSPPPSARLRKLVTTGLARPGKALSCLGAVIEGHELRAVLARAIMTSMAMLRPQGQPTKFFKNTQEVSKWVGKQLATVDAGLEREIVRATEVIRSQLL